MTDHLWSHLCVEPINKLNSQYTHDIPYAKGLILFLELNTIFAIIFVNTFVRVIISITYDHDLVAYSIVCNIQYQNDKHQQGLARSHHYGYEIKPIIAYSYSL